MIIMITIIFTLLYLAGSYFAYQAYVEESIHHQTNNEDFKNKVLSILFSWVMVIIINQIASGRKRFEQIEKEILKRYRKY